MVVNVNPYETGFDENSHVMKFSAVAKGVMTVKRGPDAAADLMTLPPVPSLPIDFKIPEIKKAKPEPRLVRISLIDNGDEEEVLYEGATFVLILRAPAYRTLSTALFFPEGEADDNQHLMSQKKTSRTTTGKKTSL